MKNRKWYAIALVLSACGWLSLQQLVAAVQAPPDTPEAVYARGLALAQGSRSPDGNTFTPPNYFEAAKLFRKAADQGFPAAQRSLGDLYLSGFGVTRDLKEAVKWFRKAAVQGDLPAQSHLGNMYASGTGVNKDDKEAAKWLQAPAEKGDAAAQLLLGSFYAGGRGVARDPAAALQLYRKAADQGLPMAQYALGSTYEVGFGGLEMSLDEAASWYRKAAAQGLALAKTALQQIEPDIATTSSPTRIGGDVAATQLIPSSPKPSYPAAARAKRLKGTVTFQGVINRLGTVRSLKVLTGDPAFNEAAMEAVRQWRYSPQLLNGSPIEVITTIVVNFSFQ